MEKKLQSYFNNIASYFKKSKTYSIGIDFGSNSLKVVALQKKDGKIMLKNYALVKMKKDISRENLRNFSGKLAAGILKKMDINKKDLNIAIPSHSSFIMLIEITGESESELRNEIEHEAAKYIPVDLSEVVFDWQIINYDSSTIKIEKLKSGEDVKGTDKVEFKKKALLVSVMKNISSKYQKSFNDNDLSIGSIEVDCFSIQRALSADPKKNYLILDIGGKTTNFIGIYQGQLLFNRNIDLAGEKITNLIAKSLNVSRDRAEKLKIEQGFETDSKNIVSNILGPAFNTIIEQAQKNLEEFEEFREGKVDRLILSGGTSEMKGVKDYIQSKMKTEVVYGNPWSGIEYPKEIKKRILADSPFFGVAAGLALIGMRD